MKRILFWLVALFALTIIPALAGFGGYGNGQNGFTQLLPLPGTSGNVLTSNGSTWLSSPAAGGTVTSFDTTAPNSMTLSADGTALAIHGAGALQSTNILTIDNLPFGGTLIVGPFGQISTTYDIAANRTLTGGQNLVVGPGGAYLAADSTAVAAGVPINIKPTTAPASPATGWDIYADTLDGHLRAKSSIGTVIDFGGP